MLAEDLAGAQRAGEVGVEDAGPLLFGESSVGVRLMMPAQLTRMSTLPKAVEGCGKQRFERGAVADVRGQAQGLAAAGFDFGGGFVHLLLAARGGDHVGAGFGEAEAEGAADPGGASGNDRNFAFKAEKIGFHDFSVSEIEQTRSTGEAG